MPLLGLGHMDTHEEMGCDGDGDGKTSGNLARQTLNQAPPSCSSHTHPKQKGEGSGGEQSVSFARQTQHKN